MDGIENAIQILKTLYQEYTLVSEKGILKFPIQLSMEEYQNKKLTSCSFNNGWCYGNGCIVYGLMRVAKFYENENEFQFYKRALSKIMSEAIEKNDFFVAAGCVLLVAASVMGLYFYKKDQTLVSFRFLLSVFWTAGEGLGVMQLSNLQSSWTNQTWLSFGGFYLLFLAGYEVIEIYLSKRVIVLESKCQMSKKEGTKEQFQHRLFCCIRIV